MFKSFAVITLLSTAALAQSSSTDPLIPTGLSDGCETFLGKLDSDSTLSACLAPLSKITSAYQSGTASATKSSLTSTLDQLCGATPCDDSTLRNSLAQFQAACAQDMNNNKDVLGLYDVLYIMSPFLSSACAKDDDNNYCLLSSGSSSNTPSRRGDSDTTLKPDAGKWTSQNIPFLLIQASDPASTLCTPCTRKVMDAYINFEGDSPYFPGLSQSTLISQQSALYPAVLDKCGKDFLNGAVQAAGGISSGIGGSLTNSATGSFKSGFTGAAALVLSTLAGIVML